MKKRVVVISDLHCGHRAGLTPTDWQYSIDSENEERKHYAQMQRILWNWYKEKIDSLGKIDVLIVNGDAIDGKGNRSGGTELVEADRIKQSDMAAECINYVQADKVYMTYGTGYHTGQDDDFEYSVFSKINKGEAIGSHLFVDINGLMFDVKHKVGSSSVPYSRNTAIAKENVWNALWADKNLQPRADIFIRSHVHYHTYCGDERQLCIVTPAMQGFGSKFGERQCSGTVDVGFIYFDIEDRGVYTWTKCILKQEFLAVQPLIA